MLPEHVAVKVDDPQSDFHGKVGFVKQNASNGIMESCDSHTDVQTCIENNCSDAIELPHGWYEIVFDPMDAGGFSHCTELFKEEKLVINGC